MIDLLIDGLAAYRLTRLARTDTISLPVRDAIEARSVEVRCECKTSDHELPSRLVDIQPYAFMRELLDCGYCTAVWCAALTLVLPRKVRRLLAVAALAGFAASMIDDREEKR